jgi:hypothetical protein
MLTAVPQFSVYAGAGNAEFKDAVESVAAAIASMLPRTANALQELANRQSDRAELAKRREELEKAVQALRDQAKAIKDKASNATLTGGDIEKAKETFGAAARELVLAGETALARLEEAFAEDLYNLLADAVAPVAKLEEQLKGIGLGALKLLDQGYDRIDKGRAALAKLVADQTSPVIVRVLDALTREIGSGQSKDDLFNVYALGDRDKNDLLVHEHELVKKAASDWPSAEAIAKLEELVSAWREPALAQLLRRFSRVDGAFLRVIVVEALDLRALRRELDRIVRELVPTKALLSYDFSTPVREFSLPGVGKVFLPAPGTRLDIRMRASIDLLQPERPDARIDGHMGPFGIQLFGKLDVVLLNFRGLDFRAGGGRPSSFDVRFGDYVIGEKAKFLKQLEPWLSPKAGLPPVRPMRDRPGIEASYGVNLGSFGVGTLSFSNVTLNAGARLPFGATDEAEFLVSIGRADAPFLISSTIFGGGGYLALLANGKGFIGLETSFDYGGVFTFGFGPLSGTGQITIGMYFRAARGSPARLGVNFMVRAAANIACFSFSVSLFIRLTYANGKMDGQAIFTFSFSIGIDDIEFTVDAYVNQGSSAGQGSPTGAFLDLPGMPATRFADMRAQPLATELSAQKRLSAQPPTRMLRVRAPAQKKNWQQYRMLFDPTLKQAVAI